jgi:hypothetical protein
MKSVRIVSGGGRVYVERLFFGFLWCRVSPVFGSNIAAWNWVRVRKDYELVRR